MGMATPCSPPPPCPQVADGESEKQLGTDTVLISRKQYGILQEPMRMSSKIFFGAIKVLYRTEQKRRALLLWVPEKAFVSHHTGFGLVVANSEFFFFLIAQSDTSQQLGSCFVQ